MAILTLMDKIISALEKGSFTIGIFLDFSKAFDTVNHSILLAKLHKYGVRGVANQWIKSYLSNRQQFCTINGYSSAKQYINCGVPQGSILGPLLFLIYINDLPNFSSSITSLLFADDSNLFASGPDLSTLQLQINIELPKLSSWLKANRLSLNISKTHAMIFGPRNDSTLTTSIKIDGITLNTVSKTKFLGVILDNKLSWKDHALYTAKKMAKSIGILSLARKLLN
jgi:ribonuclease P/MRP protein subunit RPP40